MYLTASATTDVDKLKYQLLQAKKGAMESCQLLHAQVSYIFIDLNAKYWSMKKRNLVKYCNIPNIKPGYGGIIDSAQFSTDWLQGPPDLEMMLELKWHANAAKYVNCLHASVSWTVSSIACKHMRHGSGWTKCQFILNGGVGWSHWRYLSKMRCWYS